MRFTSPTFSDLYGADMEVKRFPDGDCYVRLLRPEKGRGEAYLLHRLYPGQDQSLVQAVLMLGAVSELGYSPVLVAPYLPYSRQDKVFREGEAKSAELVCRMLKDAGAERLITFDCHFLKKKGEFEYGGLKIENLSMNGELVKAAGEKFGGPFEVISPDMGARYLVEDFGGKSMEKERGEMAEGEEAYREIKEMKVEGDFRGKSVLILDDMVSTGSTMVKAAEKLKGEDAAKVMFAATHGFFLKGSLGKLRALGEVIVSDSIPSPASEVSIKESIEAALRG